MNRKSERSKRYEIGAKFIETMSLERIPPADCALELCDLMMSLFRSAKCPPEKFN